MSRSPTYRSRLAQTLPLSVQRARRYRKVHGRRPPLFEPRTHNEKINWRIMFDRRPLLEHTCDKLAMKDHALRAVPDLVRVPETYWFGHDVAELGHVDLPDRWVLKPNNASQLVYLGKGVPAVDELVRATHGWATQEYWKYSFEWAYRKARPGLLVEEFIGVADEPPADLKVYVFDGTPRYLSVHVDRRQGQRVVFCTPDWQRLPWSANWGSEPDPSPPERLADMLAAAARLGAGYDMLRVDFYEHAGELWFGELTPYPGAGTRPLPPDFDIWRGSWWTLPDIGPRRVRRLLPRRR